MRILAAIPFVGILIGVYFVNRVTPYLFGMPFLLSYCVIWVVLTSVIMTVIYFIDPKNKEGAAE
ncbi:DUF3311 domain-containing protein [Peribacillus kribbensis]|uniref:DUF3311 domain-containing protein n=1 Tax=Peribacillus kribbensis TaxID=356658 RepID=UPI001FDEE896|nr:DUF3311 domain-containing protein [Peribacillus kribbensis]